MALEYIRRDHEASLEFSAYHEKPIVQSYIGFVHGPGLLDVDGNTISALSPSERAEADIEILTAFKVEDVYSMGRTDIGKLLGCITNVEYERIWKELITRMHSELQDSCSPDMAQLTGRGSILWTFTMVNADQVLSNREKAARFFKDCWEELVELGFDMEVDDIFMKIKHLQSFDTVYNAKDPLHRPQIAEHARYLGNPSWGDSYRNSIGKKVTTSQKAPLLAGSKRNLEQERDVEHPIPPRSLSRQLKFNRPTQSLQPYSSPSSSSLSLPQSLHTITHPTKHPPGRAWISGSSSKAVPCNFFPSSQHYIPSGTRESTVRLRPGTGPSSIASPELSFPWWLFL